MTSTFNNMQKNKIELQQILYLETGVATEDQVYQILINVIQTAAITCQFRISMPTGKNGNPKGFASVWFSDVRIPRMLMGLNQDGSDRVEFRDDPTWSLPETQEDDLDTLLSGVTNWADMADIEDEYMSKMTAPKIMVDLQPLLTFPTFEHTHSQMELLKRRNYEPSTLGRVNCNFVTVNRHYEGLSTHCISGSVPTWMTSKALRKWFRSYVTVPDPTGKYPQIKMIDSKAGKVAFITFSPASRDGQIAAWMSRDFIFNDNSHGETHLRFRYAKSRKVK